MAFDRNGFIREARAKFSDEEINAYLKSKGQKPIGKLEKFLEGETLPVLGGLVGGLATAPLGPLVSSGGAGMGTGVATGVRGSLEQLLGTEKHTVEEQNKQFFGGTKNAAVTAGTIWTLLPILKTLMDPLGQIKNLAGGVRQKSIGGQALPTEEFQQGTQQALKSNPYYVQAPFETQKGAERAMGRFSQNVNPVQTLSEGTAIQSQKIGQPEITGINDVYSQLVPFEKMGKAYGKTADVPGTSIAAGTNLASRAVREYLNTQIPRTAQMANKVYSAASSKGAENFVSKARYALGALMLWKVLGPKIAGLFNPND